MTSLADLMLARLDRAAEPAYRRVSAGEAQPPPSFRAIA
jgi:hypothetical protein